MTKATFMQELANILWVTPADLLPDRRLKDFRGWDSMGQMAMLTLLDTEAGVLVPPNWITTCETIGQVLDLAEPQLE
jgi:hypothetical protein